MTQPQLVYNAIRTPDGTVLVSKHRHDYVTYIDANGETYMVDGGLDYLRRNVNHIPYEELSVYTTDPHEKVREVCTWGTYGKSGNEPYKRIALKDMETTHIESCLALNELYENMADAYVIAFNNELSYRKHGT